MTHLLFFLSVLVAAPLAGALPLPEVTVTPPAHALPGETAVVRYTLHWDEIEAAPVVLPPGIPAIQSAATRAGRLEAQRDGQGAAVNFEMEVTPQGPGEYSVPAITFPFGLPAAWENLGENAAPQLDLASAPATSLYVSAPVPWGFYGVVAAVLLLLAAAAGAFARYRAAASRRSVASPRERAQQALHEARQRRLDGDFYAAYGALVSAMNSAPGTNEEIRERLRKRREAVGYKGAVPNEDEFADDLRAAEEALAQTNRE